MKRAFVCLFALALVACDPFPKDDDESSSGKKGSAATRPPATPKPTPAPGAWMHEKRENPLEKKAYH